MRAGILAAAALLLLPATGQASRAELDGRGMPRLLALDYSLVQILPGTAGGLGPMVAFDNGPTFNVTVLSRYRFLESDRFAFVLGGRGAVRYGYFLDGNTHNLLLAGRSGWGVTLGVSDRFIKRESSSIFNPGDSTQVENADTREVSLRKARLGLGLQSRTDSGRIYEVGLGVLYMDTDIRDTNFYRDIVREEFSEVLLRSDPGYGFDVTLRTLAPSGLLRGAGFSYEDMNPEATFPGDSRQRERNAAVQAGWRLDDTYLDDLVVGVLASWASVDNADDITQLDENDFRVVLTTNTTFNGGIFVSGEHRVWRDLIARAGVQGLGSFEKSERVSTTYLNSNFSGRYTDSDSSAQIDTPSLYLGAGWTWKSVTLDAQIRDDIRTDAPFVRWSISVAL